MAKLPTSLLPRSLPSPTTTLLTTTARPSLTPRTALPATSQVRHATAVTRPKRPFTWTQIIQLSDGSTYTTRTTSPQPVYRSTKDTRNHLMWQPSDPSLQNVEVDEAGKLAGFRTRFGTAFDLTPGAALAAQEMREDAAAQAGRTGRARQGVGKKSAFTAALLAEKIRLRTPVVEVDEVAEAAEAEEKEKAEGDRFEQLMTSYVREQPSLKGGQVAARGSDKKNKKKK